MSSIESYESYIILQNNEAPRPKERFLYQIDLSFHVYYYKRLFHTSA